MSLERDLGEIRASAALVAQTVRRLEGNQQQILVHIQSIEQHQVGQNNFDRRLDEMMRSHIDGDTHGEIKSQLGRIWKALRAMEDAELVQATQRTMVAQGLHFVFNSRLGPVLVAVVAGGAVAKWGT